jgi:hypothetical protein
MKPLIATWAPTGQPTRLARRGVTYVYNNIGSGIQFAAIAGAVSDVRKGTPTRRVPTECLTQTIRG